MSSSMVGATLLQSLSPTKAYRPTMRAGHVTYLQLHHKVLRTFWLLSPEAAEMAFLVLSPPTPVLFYLFIYLVIDYSGRLTASKIKQFKMYQQYIATIINYSRWRVDSPLVP